MSTLGRKRRADVWTHFTYDATQNKTLCKLCGATITGKNTTNLKRHLQTSHPEIHAKLQKTPGDPSGPPGAKKAKDTQQNISAVLQSVSKYNSDSKEQVSIEKAIAKWIGCTGLPVTTVEDEDFILMMETVDKKLTVPNKIKIRNLIDKHYEDEKKKIRTRLAAARRVSVGIHLWTKRGLTASFLAISSCYFCVEQNKPEHILLALEQVAHPYTALSIKACVDKCMQEWDVPNEKIITVITDNGSNMVAAFKHTTSEEEEVISEDSEDFPVMESDPKLEADEIRYHNFNMEQMPCVVLSLQLVVHLMQKEASVKRLLDKARSVVKLFLKSSVATQWILDECGLTVINDCPTRWSSTFNMIARLLKVKDSVCQITNVMGWDSLLPSEWQKLKSLHELLLPFAEHTQTLQSDTMSMSLVVPALFDLLSYLADFEENTSYQDLATLAGKMKGSINLRFAHILDPTDEKFSALAAAACFVNPNVCETLVNVTNDNIQELLKQAEEYLVQSTQAHSQHEAESEDNGDENRKEQEEPEVVPSTSKKPVFRFHSKCCSTPRQRSSTNTMRQQIRKYKEELSQPITCDTGTEFWLEKSDSLYPSLKPFALDLLAMPASQAFAERVFSVTGDLTRGKRNRAKATLAQSAYLKMNRTK
ncbi:E3 SUMO-protein ligase ZBED1-like [Melanotaenia boesemani]|uniref:E3 SUMO-protein ligase ZBED1-like n=1 Tax=Melanotaenia boesemani TaxID=1250792 RepID=UPI001C05E591|nr:E3 SUMO-protein ligase ZBED1-like [Melanotaenia boesemani]